MSIHRSIEQVNSVMHTLANDEVVDNTFGKVMTIDRELQNILRQLPANPRESLGQETADQVLAVAEHVEENQLLFGIPERWLINNVVKSAQTIQERLR